MQERRRSPSGAVQACGWRVTAWIGSTVHRGPGTEQGFVLLMQPGQIQKLCSRDVVQCSPQALAGSEIFDMTCDSHSHLIASLCFVCSAQLCRHCGRREVPTVSYQPFPWCATHPACTVWRRRCKAASPLLMYPALSRSTILSLRT